MKLSTILKAEKINIELLQRNLMSLELGLIKFEKIDEDLIKDLIKLFKATLELDFANSTLIEKKILKSKFEQLLSKKTKPKPSSEDLPKRPVISNSNTKINRKYLPNSKIKLGCVKFFDSKKGFGYVYNYDDKKDCFIKASKLITTGIIDNDIVIFETTIFEKNPRDLNAIKVSKKIPVFIFNKEPSSKSFAFPLLHNHLEKEISLNEKYETGFATVIANSKSNSWSTGVLPAEIIDKAESIAFGKAIFIKLIPNINEYKVAIDWLNTWLKSELSEGEFNSIYKDVIIQLEQKTIIEVNKEIKIIKDNPYFKIFLDEKKKTLNKISFVLWALGELENIPNPSQEEEVDIWRYEILPSLDWKLLQQVLLKLHAEQGSTKQVEETYKYLINLGWEINTKLELQEVILFLKTFVHIFSHIQLVETNFKCSKNYFYIQIYNKRLINELSEARTKQYIEELKTNDEKAAFIENLPADKILPYYFSFPSLTNYQEKYIAGILENEFSKIEYLCFDLESNGEKISEFAWKNNLSIKNEKDFKKQEDGITELVTLINSGSLIIGQNIKEFDLPILATYGASPSSDFIWDTLDVEMLLNPERFSYGLKTQHSAASDTELTYRLFKNQLSRIVVAQSNLDAVKELLPSKAIEAINQINRNIIWAMLDDDYFEKQSNEFFRPNPTNQNISENTFNQLTEKLKEEGNKVVIAPEFLWNTLSHQFDLTFYSDNKSLGFCLNKEKIEINLGETKLLKAILFRFVDSCISKKLKPYFQHLPMAIKLKLTSEQSTLICDNIDVDFRNINRKPICIKPTDVEILKQNANQVSDFKIIVVGNELYNLTSKLQLGQDLDFATIFDRLKNEPIWLQMSGGKSFISLQKSHCRQLGISEFPEFVQNIWLEKIGKGKFKVWCNLNFEACLNDLPNNEACFINWVDDSVAKTNSFIIKPDARKSGYIADQKRVNPESLYRKIYWVYQFKLFENISNSNNPKILIINNELESEKLSAYARKKGYFIPDTNASLARQLELLHTQRSPKKLLITSFLTLDKIISSNHAGPLDFIWDSFLLQEKLLMLDGKVDKGDIEITENANYVPSIKNDFINSKDFDTYKLFKLHKVLVDYFYKMIIDNHQSSSLYLSDTRLADFDGIDKSLDVKTKFLRLWNNKEEYDFDYKAANDFFPRDSSTEADFDINEAKQILRRLFLPQNEKGEFFDWYDYQHKCLDDILPAKKDLLVSLPTGAGKSVLFQAPALFRSTFTNKLSIVISPLRALMHDQVELLHGIGLYSNVEYLSGDKSHEEIKDIYRRIVSGEITLLYITPERFRSRSFENCLLTRLDADNGLEFVVFDEAHCISQWGQEFRPDYLNASRQIEGYSGVYQMKKLLFSATISEQVFDEISILMPGIVTVEGTEKIYNPVRDHINMDFKRNVAEDDRLLEISNYLKSGRFNPELSRAIIFVKSRKKVEECTLLFPDILKAEFPNCNYEDKVGAFHAGMDAEDRKDTYEKYKTGEILILFATKAFGMGMDIPNIHFVTHYSPPSTFEDFLQEVGRAGRNEKLRLEAGFNNTENPIKTLCLTTNNDFAKLKDQLHKSRISWPEIKEIKKILEDYIARFKPLTLDINIPVAVPFNLYSNIIGKADDETDTKFRIGLHWLEQLGRIKLGYFTITHLEFDSTSLNDLKDKIKNCPDLDCEKVCKSILELLPNGSLTNNVVQLSIASLRSVSKLSLENLFSALMKCHAVKILKLIQEVLIEPTQLRTDEMMHYSNQDAENKYPALKIIFSFAKEIMNLVPELESKIFDIEDGDELDRSFKEIINNNLNFDNLPWAINQNLKSGLKSKQKYLNDIKTKRFKHAYTIIRLLGKTKHESIFEKLTDSNKKIKIKQSVFNGFHKKEEWLSKIAQLQKDSIKLLDYVSQRYFNENIKKFNWPDIITDLKLKGNVKYLADLLFILSVLGYSKTGGLLPSGIEIYLQSTDIIDETQDEKNDKIIFNKFTETQEIRELKLISLQVLSNLDEDKKDAFIRGFFAAKSKLELINHLQNVGDIDDEHPIFKAFRGEAIKYQETNKLNDEQRKIYFSEVNQNINVVAGPGSGKTHTLTLRVARLLYYKFANPEEILVLAYNRAVVSELKERLGNLFKDLGFGNLAKRIKIFTFHGLAKKYCQEHLEGLEFEEWEPKLLEILNNTPGIIMNQLAPLKHILVDEFQDIDEVRMDILCRFNKLTNAHLFIIGDPNQSIYGYAREVMDPYYYYNDFDNRFNPTKFTLLDNHRSYPEILNLASQILTLPEEHKHLIPGPTKVPDEDFISNYAQIIDRTQLKVDWWDQISILMEEKVGQWPYRQIAILFRTNNEVYRGFQKIKGLNLPKIRIRIQGNLPYEFTRIRECHTVILYLKSKIGQHIPLDFKHTFQVFIDELINQNQNWNHFYIRVIYSLVLEYLEEQDEGQVFDNLLEFITELTYKDDGQLYKIYEKHLGRILSATHETEIVLTTMHKVKGLEFDSVIITPSYSNLAFNQYTTLTTQQVTDQINEEKRLAFVAYTRARYRLFVVDFERELALKSSRQYQLPELYHIALGIAVEPEIKKLNIGWAAKTFNFNAGINKYINENIRGGDFLFIKRRIVPNNGNPFTVHEIFKDGSTRVIGELSRDAGELLKHSEIRGLIVNEVVVWTYEDTIKFDKRKPINFDSWPQRAKIGKPDIDGFYSDYHKNWCHDAKNQGYIYLVDFAGFGVPIT
jgi:RecQ family ATP-dependent DNA helicase